MRNTVAIPPDWATWIGENLSLGVAQSRILDILVDNGFDRRIAAEQLARAGCNAPPPSVQTVAQQLKNLESLLDVYSDLWSKCRGTGGVDRVSGLRAEVFFRWYYSVNHPVVLLDRMADWPALEKWTPDYFKARFGSEQVEVMMGRNSDAAYEINCERHKTSMRLDRYVDLIETAGETNDFYMVANNRSIEAGNMRRLLDDIRFTEGFLDPASAAARLFLWFGPAGTVTPLHYDTMNVLFAQVLGRKKFTLIPSFQSHLVYNHVGVYSQVDCEAPDYDQFPLFRKVTRLEVVLEPGELLFIPVGWWHHVRSLDVSMSVSFTNFLTHNSYAWHTPGYRE